MTYFILGTVLGATLSSVVWYWVLERALQDGE